ncbi:hypothetical protein CSA_023974, partial [Cucumis sativus]
MNGYMSVSARERLSLLICIAQKKLKLKTERQAYALSANFLLKLPQ